MTEVLDGHRPALWVSDVYGAQRGHGGEWQVCLARQLRDCTDAIEAGDAVFTPRMKALLLLAVVLARRHRDLAGSTRRDCRRRLERALDAVMVLAPSQRDDRRLRRRYGRLRAHLFTFLDYPGLPADDNGVERDLLSAAIHRNVIAGIPGGMGPKACMPPCDAPSAPPRAGTSTPMPSSSRPYTDALRLAQDEQLPST